jgi:hypothetical protein
MYSSEHLRQSIDDELKSLEKSAQALKVRRNILAPISRLPPETIAIIFTFLSLPGDNIQILAGEEQDDLSRLRVSHVCHQWREIALGQPRLWSNIDFTTLTVEAVTEILSRSKMAPLELNANLCRVRWQNARFDAFQGQLVAHVSHTCRLNIIAKSPYLQTIVGQLVSPAPDLERLMLIVNNNNQHLGIPARAVIPSNLFDGTAPRLSHLQLNHCDISWTSPLLKNLRLLDLHTLSPGARPSLGDWLDAMSQMLKLKTLVVHFATPIAPSVQTTISDPARIITHPSLAQLYFVASASDCAFALSHLVLPALTSVHIDAISEHPEAHDVRELIPYISRNAHGPQDVKPLQSMIISGGDSLTEIIAWTEPDADIEVRNAVTLMAATLAARAIFTISSHVWRLGTDLDILDATLAALPLGSLRSLTVQNSSHFPEGIWLRHAPCWKSLAHVRLVDVAATKSFTEVLHKDAGRDGPLLPSLTKLSLVNTLFHGDDYLLLDMVNDRVELGVPLRSLDLRACPMTPGVVQLLRDMVPEIQGPDPRFLSMARWPTLSNWGKDMALLFQRDVDEYGDLDLEDFFDDEIVNPWSHGYYDGDDDDEDDEEDDDDDDGGEDEGELEDDDDLNDVVS